MPSWLRPSNVTLGAACVNQPSDAVFPTTFNDVLRAEDVDFVVIFPRATDARDAADMKHGIHALASADHGLLVAQIGVDDFYAKRFERRALATAYCTDAVTPHNQLFDDIESQKAVRPGNKCIH